MAGRSSRGSKSYGGCGSSHSTTTAFGSSRKRKPLKGFPMEGKFSTIEEIDAYLSGERIVCLECGHAFKALGKHIATHGLSGDSYKEKYGIPRTRGLCNDEVSAAISKHVTALNASLSAGEMRDKLDKARAKQRPLKGKRVNLCAAASDKIKKAGKKNKGLKRKLKMVKGLCNSCGTEIERPLGSFKRRKNKALCDVCRGRNNKESVRKYTEKRKADPVLLERDRKKQREWHRKKKGKD